MTIPLFLVLILWPVSVGFATFWLIRMFAATLQQQLCTLHVIWCHSNWRLSY